MGAIRLPWASAFRKAVPAARGTQTSSMLARASVAAPACKVAKYQIWKWRLLLPGASEPRLRLLRPQGFNSVFQTALRGLGNRSIVVVGNYEFGPITVEPCRAKARPLRPRRSYFAPAGNSDQEPVHPEDGCVDQLLITAPWWRRRVLPPGPIGLLRRPFIAIAGLRR